MIYEAIDRWNSPYLAHYGVKGMKWGVRKKIETSGFRRRSSFPIRGIKTSKKFNRTARKVIKAAAITGGVLAVYAIGKHLAYKSAGVSDPHILRNTLKGFGKVSSKVISHLGPKMAKASVKVVNKVGKKAFDTIKDVRIKPEILGAKKIVKSSNRLKNVIKKNGKKVAMRVINSSSFKINGFKIAIGDLKKAKNSIRRTGKKFVKDVGRTRKERKTHRKDVLSNWNKDIVENVLNF